MEAEAAASAVEAAGHMGTVGIMGEPDAIGRGRIWGRAGRSRLPALVTKTGGIGEGTERGCADRFWVYICI